METRKVQFIGGATLSVSLPKSWAEPAGVKAGDRIGFVPLANGALKLTPLGANGGAAASRALVELRPGEDPEQQVLALYLAGNDVIEVVLPGGLTSDVVQSLENVPRRVLGLEIMDRREDRVVIQDLLDTSGLDAVRVFDRMYAIASGMMRDIVGALARRDPRRLAEVAIHRTDLDRLGWVAAKQQNMLVTQGAREGSTLTPADAIAFATATVYVRRLGAHAERLSEDVLSLLATDHESRVRVALADAGAAVLQQCDEAARALSRGEVGAARSAAARVEPMDARMRELHTFVATCAAQGKVCAPCVRATPVVNDLQGVSGIGADLAHVALMRAIPRAHGALVGPLAPV